MSKKCTEAIKVHIPAQNAIGFSGIYVKENVGERLT